MTQHIPLQLLVRLMKMGDLFLVSIISSGKYLLKVFVYQTFSLMCGHL